MKSDKKIFTVAALLASLFLCYSFLLFSSLPVASYNKSAQAQHGKKVWQKYNCNSCHQIYGLGGYLGPDLTNEASLRSEEFITAFLKSGTATMPDFKLSDNEIKSLLAFFRNIDSSGKSDPRTFKIHTDGTINQ